MKVFAGLVVATSAISNRIREENSWPGNDNAPYCGCNLVIDAAEVGGYINKTCSLSFLYPVEDPHFVSVASSYMLGRNRQTGPDVFKFTGFDEVSNPDVLDILVFYDEVDCPKDDNNTARYCEHNLKCLGRDDEGGEDNVPPEGVYLGNFNYDIARSVQTYTVPVYGLEQGQKVTFEIVDYDGKDNYCHSAKSHVGHGSVEPGSCSPTNDTCGNAITYIQNPEHQGLLEYFSFEPVSPANSPGCWDMPLHHLDDYKWQTPSPWDTQQKYNDRL